MTGDCVRRTHGCATAHVGKLPRSVTTARSPYEPSGVGLAARSYCLPRTCLSMLISGSRGSPNTLTCERARAHGSILPVAVRTLTRPTRHRGPRDHESRKLCRAWWLWGWLLRYRVPDSGPLLRCQVPRQCAGIDAALPQELPGSAGVDVARVRDDTVEGSASAGEYRAYELLVPGALRAGNQRIFAPADLDDAAIDAGAWSETPGGNPAVEVEGEPGRGLCGQHGGATDPAAFAGDLPLRKEHRLSPGADAEKSAQDRGGEMEGDVPHDHGVVERDGERVGVIDFHIRQRAAEASDPVLIEVNSGHRPAELGERSRECAVSSAKFE